MTGSIIGGQDKVNPVFWLAIYTWARNVALCCPLGIPCSGPTYKEKVLLAIINPLLTISLSCQDDMIEYEFIGFLLFCIHIDLEFDP